MIELSDVLTLDTKKGDKGEDVFELDFTPRAPGQEPYEVDETGVSVFITKQTALKLAWGILKSLGEPNDE